MLTILSLYPAPAQRGSAVGYEVFLVVEDVFFVAALVPDDVDGTA